MRDPILQSQLPEAPWLNPALWKLPGTVPIDPLTWLCQDDAFAAQMAERDRLIAERPDTVLAMTTSAQDAANECLDLILETLGATEGYVLSGRSIERPDGVAVALDRAQPMMTIGRLIQEDICLLENESGGEHRLTAACLCFPASWTLAEKIGRPLTRIHAPVDEYDAGVAKRVQRMFDAIRPEIALMRANALLYHAPELHQPRREGASTAHSSRKGQYLRSERQTLRRLPDSGAVVFAIHTFVVPVGALNAEARATLGLVADRYEPASEHPE